MITRQAFLLLLFLFLLNTIKKAGNYQEDCKLDLEDRPRETVRKPFYYTGKLLI